MIRTRPVLVAVVLAAFAWTTLSAAGQSPEARALQEAIDLIESKGDYTGALAKLEMAARSQNRTVAARALWYEAQIHERTDLPRAIAVYERLVAEFSAERDVMIEARARLAALQPAPRGPSERLITNDRTLGGIGGPRWSPDGRFVIGLRLGGGEFSGSGLYLRNTGDATGRVLFNRAPGFGGPGFWVFSPDSRRFAALMPEAQEGLGPRIIRGEIDPALVSAKGVLVVGSVAAGEAPMVVEVAEMGAIGPFPPFTNPLAWSPDGRFLAVALPVAPLRTADLQVMDMSTGELRSLGLRSAGAFDLSWSPDGADLLVHVARPDGTAELHVAHVSTAASRALALPGAPGARLRVVRWVNGREIHVRHLDSAKPEVEDTFLINADTGRARKTCSGQAFNLDGAGGLPTAKGDICREITLDGTRQIVWNHGSKQLMIRDLATGMDRPLTTSSGEEYYGRLSPDDEIEVFVSNREGRWALYAARIDDAPVGRPTQLSVFDDVPTALNPIWTPDGFVAQLVRRESNVLRVDLDPATGKVLSEARRLTQDGSQNYTPMVSPDGQRIVYWSRQGSRFGLAVMDSNGANERIVAEVPEDYPGLRPSWRSPSEILVTTPPEGSSATFYLTAPAVTPRTVMSVSVSTGGALSVGELRDMPTISGQPQYLPKSGEAVYLDETYRVLRSLSLVNGSTRAVATFDGDLEVSSFMPSPDGARVAYSLARRYPNGRDCFERTGPPVERANDLRTASCELGVLDLATGERAILASTRTPQEVAAWSPDGRFLLYGAANGPRIMDTASPDYANWPLLEPGRQLNWENRTADWAPDGTFVVLTNSAQIWEWRQWSGVRSK